MSFLNLKGKSDDFLSEVQDSIEKSNKGGGYEQDETSFYPQLDKEGNGFAIIRFMPPGPNDTKPFVKMMSHWFDGKNGRKYIENCPTTKGRGNPCPACEANGELWKTGEDGKNIVRRYRKRKTHYYTNVYVVSDPKNPEREGGVYKFKFGVKIWEKIQAAAEKSKSNPNYVPFNPFDLWTGANFKLEIRKVDKQTNYDLASFEAPTPLADDDALLERAWNKCYTLNDITSDDQFKTYDELKTKVQQVLGNPSAAVNTPSAPMAEPSHSAAAQDAPLDLSGGATETQEPEMFPASNGEADQDFFKDI